MSFYGTMFDTDDPTPTRPHILVVDDEPLLRMVLVDLLEGEGYAVREASDAAEALALLKAEPAFRIVVTDIQMPGSMDGLRLAQYIHDAYPPIALIICSGAVSPDRTALPDQAVFMPKPVDRALLISTVRSMAA
ncbi:MAG: response regulator [Sphingobium sp.]